MSIFIPSVMFDAMRNKIGNIVFLDGNGGPSIRELVTPYNPKSARQIAARLVTAQIAQAWRDTLTDQQREDWTKFGKQNPSYNALGKKVRVSGIAAYMRSNIPLITFSIGRIDDVPNNFNVSSLDVSGVALKVLNNQLVYTVPAGYVATDFMYARLTPSHSPGRNSVKSLLRLLFEDAQDLPPAGGAVIQTIDADQPINVLAETRSVELAVMNSVNGAISLSETLKIVVEA